jgi:metal-responsive CopG/Arc/MetJ family transcriptional regulator
MPTDLVESIDQVRYRIGAINGEAPDRSEFIIRAAEDRLEELRTELKEQSEHSEDVAEMGGA